MGVQKKLEGTERETTQLGYRGLWELAEQMVHMSVFYNSTSRPKIWLEPFSARSRLWA